MGRWRCVFCRIVAGATPPSLPKYSAIAVSRGGGAVTVGSPTTTCLPPPSPRPLAVGAVAASATAATPAGPPGRPPARSRRGGGAGRWAGPPSALPPQWAGWRQHAPTGPVRILAGTKPGNGMAGWRVRGCRDGDGAKVTGGRGGRVGGGCTMRRSRTQRMMAGGKQGARPLPRRRPQMAFNPPGVCGCGARGGGTLGAGAPRLWGSGTGPRWLFGPGVSLEMRISEGRVEGSWGRNRNQHGRGVHSR